MWEGRGWGEQLEPRWVGCGVEKSGLNVAHTYHQMTDLSCVCFHNVRNPTFNVYSALLYHLYTSIPSGAPGTQCKISDLPVGPNVRRKEPINTS